MVNKRISYAQMSSVLPVSLVWGIQNLLGGVSISGNWDTDQEAYVCKGHKLDNLEFVYVRERKWRERQIDVQY
jgi:hypothetical protein